MLITGLVYFLGGATSPFSLLYLIVIAVASTLLRRRAGVIVASAAFLLYGGMIVALYFGWLKPATPAQEVIEGWRLGYNLAVHGFGFYVVALLTYYLAHNVTRAERALEEKSEHLADLQVVHRDVIQSITSGLLTTDLEGTVTSANLAGLEILGREEAELVGLADRPVGAVRRPSTGARRRPPPSRPGACAPRCRRRAATAQTRDVGFTISRLDRRRRQPPRVHHHLPGPHPLAAHPGGAADEGPHGRRRRARGRAGARDRQPAARRSRARSRCSPAGSTATPRSAS